MIRRIIPEDPSDTWMCLTDYAGVLGVSDYEMWGINGYGFPDVSP